MGNFVDVLVDIVANSPVLFWFFFMNDTKFMLECLTALG